MSRIKGELAERTIPLTGMMGVDAMHFGVLMVVNLAIGMLTPPVGICLFVA